MKLWIVVTTVLLGLVLGYGSSSLIETGFFVDWESLGDPPDEVSEILYSGGYNIYIKTNTDKVYVHSKLEDCSCWTETVWPTRPIPASYPLAEDIFWVKAPPGEVVKSIAVTGFDFEAKTEAKYVVLVDGSVWRWFYGVHGTSIQYLILSCLGGVIGLTVGLTVAASTKLQKMRVNSKVLSVILALIAKAHF